MRMEQLLVAQQHIEEILPAERARLVRLCALLSGDPGAAEDLAQETLFEAWRNADNLRDPERRSQWLSGIARNVVLRWQRKRRQEDSRRASLHPALDEGGNDPAEPATGPFDVEIELERGELAALLDKALALLPATTRLVLIERFVNESPQAEVAAKLGLSEGAVAMRLQRGKLAMRRVLAGELEQGWTAAGVDESGWQQTTMWCPWCGRRKLVGRIWITSSQLVLRCPDCNSRIGRGLWELPWEQSYRGARTFKLALDRTINWAYDYFRTAIDTGSVACRECGRTAECCIGEPLLCSIELTGATGVFVKCEGCGSSMWAGISVMAHSTPEVRRFWNEHPRMYSPPDREIEVDGRPALVIGFASMSGAAKVEVVQSLDTLRLIGVYRA